jgi:hypothetical protein
MSDELNLLMDTDFMTFVSKSISINCKIIGGIPPYSNLNWSKYNDDDPIIFSNQLCDSIEVSSSVIGTYIIYVTVIDSTNTELSRQIYIEIKDDASDSNNVIIDDKYEPLTAIIKPDDINLDLGDIIKLTLHINRNKNEIDESGWISRDNGYIIQTKTNNEVTIKAVNEGAYEIIAYISTSNETIFEHSIITIKNKHPIINYTIHILELIKSVNIYFYEMLIEKISSLKRI